MLKRAGKKIANPIGQIWSGAMMLEHLGHHDAAHAIVKGNETVRMEGPRTRDIGGTASANRVGWRLQRQFEARVVV